MTEPQSPGPDKQPPPESNSRPPKQAGEGQSAPENGIDMNVKKVSGESVNIIGQSIKNYAQEPKRPFSAALTAPLSHEKINEMLEGYRFHPQILDKGVQILTDRRVLIIAGEQGIGKTSLALRLAERFGSENAMEGCRLVQSLSKTIQIDPAAPALQQKDFSKQTLVFKDVLSCGNQDLMDFFQSLDVYQLEHNLSPQLARRGGVLIFTAANSHFRPYLKKLSTMGIVLEPDPPSIAEFEIILRRKIIDLCKSRGIPPTLSGGLLATEALVRLHQSLRSYSRLNLFLSRHLADLIQEKATLDNALRHFDDVHQWLFEIAPKDFEVWSHVLALILLSYDKQQKVPWFDYLYFHEQLVPVLKKAFPNNRKISRAGFYPSDKMLFMACKAKVTFSLDLQANHVHFIDHPIVIDRLWKELVTHGKRILSPLLDALRDLIEKDTKPENQSHYLKFTRKNEVIARILGHVSRMEPKSAVTMIVARWINEDKQDIRQALGHFILGVHGSGDPRHLQLTYQIIDGYVKNIQSMDSEIDDPKELTRYENQTSALVVAGFIVVEIDPNWAFGVIAEVVNQKLKMISRDLTEQTLVQGDKLQSVYNLVGGNRRKILYILLREMFELGNRLGPMILFYGLISKMPDRQEQLRQNKPYQLGDLVPLLCLMEGGLFDLWAPPVDHINRKTESRPPIPSNLIVDDVLASRMAVKRLATFLDWLYRTAVTLHPSKLRLPLHNAMIRHLRNWIYGAIDHPERRDAIKLLVAEIINHGHKNLRNSLFQLLNSEGRFAVGEGIYRRFADSILRTASSMNRPTTHALAQLNDADPVTMGER